MLINRLALVFVIVLAASCGDASPLVSGSQNDRVDALRSQNDRVDASGPELERDLVDAGGPELLERDQVDAGGPELLGRDQVDAGAGPELGRDQVDAGGPECGDGWVRVYFVGYANVVCSPGPGASDTACRSPHWRAAGDGLVECLP